MVAIKDFEMPRHCNQCNFCKLGMYDNHLHCCITGTDVDDMMEHRHKDCPLVEENMEMTIDEKTIEMLTDILVGFEQGYHIAPSKERIAVLHKVIDTMRKYQKLKQTLGIIFALGDENPRRIVKISELREALEDGNDN